MDECTYSLLPVPGYLTLKPWLLPMLSAKVPFAFEKRLIFSDAFDYAYVVDKEYDPSVIAQRMNAMLARQRGQGT